MTTIDNRAEDAPVSAGDLRARRRFLATHHNAKRPFSGPTISPEDRHAPPGTPFKHGHHPLVPLPEPRHPHGHRQPSDVGFVNVDGAGRTGTPASRTKALRPSEHPELFQIEAPHHRNVRPQTPARTAAPKSANRFFRPRGGR